MAKMNPFDISFGKTPAESVSRIVQSHEILSTFTSDLITQQIYMITGVRGSGKTVLMNTIANSLETEKDWIIIRLNPDRDLLTAFAAKLGSHPGCFELFKKAKINLSFFGFGVEFEGVPPITDIEAALEAMLKSLKKRGTRVLVTIDEVTNSPYIRTFAGSFQIFIGQELPVFLLMTGLYENIEALQNEKHLTFLYRAPKLLLPPLSLSGMAERYEQVFDVPHTQALSWAKETNGYSFAFQALGYAIWNHPGDESASHAEFRLLLEEYVYEKIWTELSPKDKRIVEGIAHCPSGLLHDITDYLKLKPDEINQYRKRLIRKGIVTGEERGILRFTLPLFDAFVLDRQTLS